MTFATDESPSVKFRFCLLVFGCKIGVKMENPEEILHSLEEFTKMKPKDIPNELEEYLKFVAKSGDPIYQWSAIKSLFREKFLNVITEFYESCASVEIPPCPNVEMFNYDLMKSFILEKLDAFASAPFTLQRICELLTSPRKEYTRIDKYMRALEKNILVVSTMEPGGRRTENGEGIMNGIESDHELVPEPGNEINVEEIDESPYIQTTNHLTERLSIENAKNDSPSEIETAVDTFTTEKLDSEASTSSQEIVCVQYVSIEPVDTSGKENVAEEVKDEDVSVTITAVSIKEEEEIKPEQVVTEVQPEAVLVENIMESAEEVLEKKPLDTTTSTDISMETDLTHSNDVEENVPHIEESTETSPNPIVCSDAQPSTTVADEQPESSSETQPETEELKEDISPEHGITSSWEGSEDVAVEDSSNNSKDSKGDNVSDLQKDTSDDVNSTTDTVSDNPCGDNKQDEGSSEPNENSPSEIEIPTDVPSIETITEKVEENENNLSDIDTKLEPAAEQAESKEVVVASTFTPMEVDSESLHEEEIKSLIPPKEPENDP